MTLSISEYRNKVKELNDSFLLDLKEGLKLCINKEIYTFMKGVEK